jgi:hypothetical protein
MKKIIFIYDNLCDDCLRIESILDRHAKNDPDIKLVKYLCELDIAVDLAIEHDIDSLPACIIGKTVLQGKSVSNEQIEFAIKNA